MTIVDLSWQDAAVCAQVGGENWHPDKGGSTREAKRICLGCEVRDECLAYAMSNDERSGIWGGLSERERRRLKRGETVVPAVNNKPNRKANGHGHACKCFACMHIRNESA